jgi:hypothetical protein
MTDFDANEDPLRLSGAANGEPFEPAKLRPRFMPRARQLAYGQCFRRPLGRLTATLASQPTRAVARSCPPADRLASLGTPPRRRRRLWTACHGRPPGFPS